MSYISQCRKWQKAVREPCKAKHGMVASKHPLIGKTGIEILKKGGNAIDAAVAAAFVDCVVEPAMNGIGGEGVMALHMGGKNIIIDYVGRPSKDCTPDIYELLEEPEPGWMGWKRVKDDANITGYKACTVPGTVAGLTTALKRYGTMELIEVMEPAIQIAEGGFTIGWWTVSHIVRTMEKFSQFPEWSKIFLKNGQYPPTPYSHALRTAPDQLINKDLARSLTLVAEQGPDAFYKGSITERIVDEMAENCGMITTDDFARYEPIILEPVPGKYSEFEVIYDPSHAGTTLMEMLNVVEGFDLAASGFGSREHLHIVAEAIGFAYADRFVYMGDPSVIEVPQKGLTSKEYAKELRARINLKHAATLTAGTPWSYEECTTAFAVVDKDRNTVVINQTLVNSFGSGVVIAGTGIVMNNAMYGLNPEPNHANSIKGRKRRIQNVCPTILLKDRQPFMAVGAPGGRAIQTSILQTIINVIDFEMDIQSAIEAPRITREIGEIQMDNRFQKSVCDELRKMGHDIAYIDKEIGNWARPVGITVDHRDQVLYGGVECHFLGFESEAIGY